MDRVTTDGESVALRSDLRRAAPEMGTNQKMDITVHPALSRAMTDIRASFLADRRRTTSSSGHAHETPGVEVCPPWHHPNRLPIAGPGGRRGPD
jgi:hypothetical protein